MPSLCAITLRGGGANAVLRGAGGEEVGRDRRRPACCPRSHHFLDPGVFGCVEVAAARTVVVLERQGLADITLSRLDARASTIMSASLAWQKGRHRGAGAAGGAGRTRARRRAARTRVQRRGRRSRRPRARREGRAAADAGSMRMSAAIESALPRNGWSVAGGGALAVRAAILDERRATLAGRQGTSLGGVKAEMPPNVAHPLSERRRVDGRRTELQDVQSRSYK